MRRPFTVLFSENLTLNRPHQSPDRLSGISSVLNLFPHDRQDFSPFKPLSLFRSNSLILGITEVALPLPGIVLRHGRKQIPLLYTQDILPPPSILISQRCLLSDQYVFQSISWNTITCTKLKIEIITFHVKFRSPIIMVLELSNISRLENYISKF